MPPSSLLPSPVFEEFREALHDLLHGNVPPGERRAAIAVMKDTLVHARLGLEDLRASVEQTRKRLERERKELETVQRRKGLAQGIADAETVQIAERFEAQHAERVAVLGRKLEAQQEELALVEREVEEMTSQLKAAAAGVGSGMPPGTVGGAPADLGGVGGTAAGGAGLDDEHSALEQEIAGLDRAQRRAAAEAEADARLAELKRRMGK